MRGEEKERKECTVMLILNKMAEEICDHYCKYADMYFEDAEELVKHCWECPLNLLGS